MLQRSLLLMLALGSTAFAQQDTTEDGTRIQYKAVTEIEIDGLEIEGQLVGPQHGFVVERKRASFNPLIKLRTDFNAEMSSSVTEVK